MIVGGSPNILVAKTNTAFTDAGITGSNVAIIYLTDTVAKVFKSYVPGRGINPITGFESGKGYLINALVDFDLAAYTVPPFEATPPPADYVLDTFTDVDDTDIGGRISDSGHVWTIRQGGISLLDNAATGSASFRGLPSIATVEMPSSDYTIEIDISLRNQSARPGGIICRHVDNNNYFLIQLSATGNGFRLYEMNAGTLSLRNFAPYTGGSSIKVVCKGNVILGYMGGSIVEYTAATNNVTSTRVGIYMERDTNTGDVGGNLFDQIESFLAWEGDGTPPPNTFKWFTLDYPQPYQVFQRSGTTGPVMVKGAVYNDTGGLVSVEARWNGGSWSTIATSVTSAFEGELTSQAQGQGALELRILQQPTRTTSIPDVGVGDVYCLAGQSNISGLGDTTNPYVPQGNLKAGLFGNDYRWRELHYPVDSPKGQVDQVSKDEGATGSYITKLATFMLESRGVPVAFIPTPKGGTGSILWLPDNANVENRNTLFGAMVYRCKQVPGGIKAVLWHQGESDAVANGFTGKDTYKARLKTIASAIFTELGVSTVVARIHLWNEAPTTTLQYVNDINSAMAEASTENPLVLLGPDLLNPQITGALHFTSDADMNEVAGRWMAALTSLGI